MGPVTVASTALCAPRHVEQTIGRRALEIRPNESDAKVDGALCTSHLDFIVNLPGAAAKRQPTHIRPKRAVQTIVNAEPNEIRKRGNGKKTSEM